MIKKCEICGKEFETTNFNKKYCSPECAKQGLKIRDARRRGADIIKDCPICGERFEIGKNGALTKYCSQGCADEARRIRNRDRWRDDKGLSAEEVRCEQCGKTISGRRIGSKFCSEECRSKAIYESRRERHGHTPMREHKEKLARQRAETKKRIEKERKAKIKTKECAECGQPFETMRPNQLTCSTECSRLRRNRLSWQYEEKRYNNTNVIDKDISVKVLYKRDKGICYICGGKCDFDDNYKVNGHFTVGPSYPSIDHLIPLARGGMHAWDNVKLAHHLCNTKKSDILPSELELDVEINDAYALARKVSPRKKQVKQFTKDGMLIATYESTIEASKQTGIKAKGIQNCAREECKTCRGFKWEYV